MKLETLKFIEENSDWKNILTQPPYSLTIKEDDDYYLLKYNQIESDFSQRIVKECRGLILDKSNLKPVGLSFLKFHNFGEPYADTIDWTSAEIMDKIDGSKILVWYDKDKWHVSTSGTIDAYEADVSNLGFTFGQLFDEAIDNSVLTRDDFYDILNKDRCYTFELVSPKAPIVIKYPKTKIYLIGIRDKKTFDELDIYKDELARYISTPERFLLYSLDECIKASEVLPPDKEGYVVRDKYFNRIKIKNPTYLYLHHLNNNGVLSLSRLLGIVEENELDEFCTYFPEWKEELEKIKEKKEQYLVRLEAAHQALEHKLTNKDWILTTIELKDNISKQIIKLRPDKRKEIATYITKELKDFSSYLFKYLDDKTYTVLNYWNDLSLDRKVELLKLKESKND